MTPTYNKNKKHSIERIDHMVRSDGVPNRSQFANAASRNGILNHKSHQRSQAGAIHLPGNIGFND